MRANEKVHLFLELLNLVGSTYYWKYNNCDANEFFAGNKWGIWCRFRYKWTFLNIIHFLRRLDINRYWILWRTVKKIQYGLPSFGTNFRFLPFNLDSIFTLFYLKYQTVFKLFVLISELSSFSFNDFFWKFGISF